MTVNELIGWNWIKYPKSLHVCRPSSLPPYRTNQPGKIDCLTIYRRRTPHDGRLINEHVFRSHIPDDIRFVSCGEQTPPVWLIIAEQAPATRRRRQFVRSGRFSLSATIAAGRSLNAADAAQMPLRYPKRRFTRPRKLSQSKWQATDCRRRLTPAFRTRALILQVDVHESAFAL